MAWSLEWWPWAIRHGVDPFTTHLFWPPWGFSTLWMTTIPVPALFALPVTLTAGPLVAYNLLMLLAVPLAAGAAYLLCRELTGHFWASLAGGLLFGLSPYMLGHTLSQHLDLTFVFPVPLLGLLVVRYLRGRTSRRHFVGGFAALLLVQLGSSFELFLDLTLLVAVGGALALLGGASKQVGLLRAGGLIALAYAVCLPLLVPIAVLALSAPHAALRYAPGNYAVDLLNLVVPTPTSLAGTFQSARAVSQHFVSNIGEQDAYLGLPLLAVTLLAVRVEWRRGGWLVGGLLLAVILLSLGPTLTVGGRPLVRLPFAMSRLPLLGNALPARLSLFAALGAACLGALWLARPQRGRLRLVVGAVVVVSLLPNFWPSRRLPGAWARSDAFGWSHAQVPAGFAASRAWTRLIKPGSTVLVLPTGDATAASYWQAKTGMRFALAVPDTPFVPPQIGAAPTVVGLVNNNLPTLAGQTLGAARLRAYLLTFHVSAVVLTPVEGPRWRGLVARATAVDPVSLDGAAVYPLPTTLTPLSARGTLLVSRTRDPGEALVSRVTAWLSFDGRRAHLGAKTGTGGSSSRERIATLSSPSGDAELVTAVADDRGRAAIAFVEWRNHQSLLRVANLANGNWRVTTLDSRTQPIWMPRVAIAPDGTTLAAWIDQNDPTETVRAAALPPAGTWQRPVTLENASGLASVELRAGAGDLGVLAWQDTVAGETRARVTTSDGTTWAPVATIASSLDNLVHLTLAGPAATRVRWEIGLNPMSAKRFEARRIGTTWTRPIRTARRTPATRRAGARPSGSLGNGESPGRGPRPAARGNSRIHREG